MPYAAFKQIVRILSKKFPTQDETNLHIMARELYDETYESDDYIAMVDMIQ